MKTILYEMNEVPKRLFDFYAASKPNSSFGKLRSRANLYTTTTADIGHLSPWITWPTLHRGVSNISHEICDLGQNLSWQNKEMPPIWSLLADKGVSVGVFGSLQSYPLVSDLSNYKFYVPDTFAAGSECFPESLSAFQKFNLSMVRQNGRNVSSRIAMRDAADFISKAPFLGLRGATMMKLSKQLVEERLVKDRVVRRRSSQIEIAFDFFIKQLNLTLPDISFFFTNHVASSLHRYWPTVFPQDYEDGKFDPQWLQKWSAEIPHAVKVADQQLGYLIKFAEKNNCRLVVLSSMGQGAVEDVEPLHRQVILTNISNLMSYLGFQQDEWEPRLAMAPRVVVKPKCQDYREKIARLKEITINGSKINYKFLDTGDVRFDIWCVNQDELRIVDEQGHAINPAELGLSNIHLQDASGSYAYHIPEGILLDYVPGNTVTRLDNAWANISVLDVAPSIMAQFNIAKPEYMDGDTGLFRVYN